MSFWGSIGGTCGSGGSGDARLLSDSPYDIMPTATMANPRLVYPSIAQPMFNNPVLSLALKPKREGMGDLVGQSFDPGLMERAKEDEYESRSGSDHLAGASGDDQDTTGNKSRRKKKYHRHTPYQIQELESSFKENPHPEEKARLELGKKLGLESKQVKFWFQNRRTQMKTQLEHHENTILKQENDNLRIENIAIKENMRNPICTNCGHPAILGEISLEEHHIRIENARLRDELNRISVLASRFLGKPLPSLGGFVPLGISNAGLELAVGRNGFGGLSSVDSAFSMGLDFGNGISNDLPVVPPTRPAVSMTSLDVPLDRSLLLQLSLAAMDELMKLAQTDNPLWFKNLNGEGEALNIEEYARTFPPCIGMKPSGFKTEATRATGTIIMNSIALVETLMDTNRWAEMFPCIIGRTTTLDVISSGMDGTRNGALQLMHAEHQLLSPLVPVRQVKFLRFCKQHAEGVWAVVDVSVDTIQEGSNAHAFVNCRRLPSGCVVQDMPNGYSKVIWVEHSECDQSAVHQLYRPLVRSGMGFGAQRWVATLQWQCECLAVMMPSIVSNEDHAVITPSGRRSVAKLAQRMIRNFCAGVCATVHQWEVVQVGNVVDDVRLMIRKSIGNPGEPPGIVLSATMAVWMPVSHQRLFDFLRNEQLRSQWDVLSYDGPMQHMALIAKGLDRGNNISILGASDTAAIPNQHSMLILQETSTDASGSVIVYAAVDMPAMNVLMNGGDSSCVVFLPSGFAIVPDCLPDSGRLNNCNGTLTKEGSSGSSNGSLLTIGFQILVNSLPEAKLTIKSVETVKALISRTLQGIKAALHCN
ncbi:unnamed protein product [Ilex paraguariensis]|uniref:Homeobox-leucine zipper protein ANTHOCYANINLESS 2 n=1 Tax=Ilex paraguariensis TaxID=185542 RepID=A0ABC8T1K8_9AQUA